MKKLKEYQLGKADAKQVQQLMEKVSMFKSQLEEQKEKIAEMSKKFDVVDDVQMLKTKVDQAYKALNGKVDIKFKDEIRGNLTSMKNEI